MINIEKLKNKILQLAFKGKLVKQKTGTESATSIIDVLCKIKSKKYASFDDSLVDYDIPSNWGWCMTYQVISLENGKDSKQKGLPYLDVKFLRTGRNPKLLNQGELVEKGTKLILVDGENSGEVFTAPETGYKGSTLKVLKINNLILDKFYFYFIKLYKERFKKNKTGSAIPHLDKTIFFETPIPIPPTEEQERIVNKLDELFVLLDGINKDQISLKVLFSKLKRKIVNESLKGKIVEQRIEEGTAQDLYGEIQKEKQKLIKAGNIKKDKLLSSITEEEIPYEIPKTWKWCRIGSIFTLQAGKNVTSSSISDEQNEKTPYECFGGNGLRGFVKEYNRNGFYPIIGRQGALCGCINIAKGKFFATEHAVVVDHYGMTDPEWAALFLKALNLNQYATATAQPGLSVTKVNQVLIPLPPLKEQKRIIERLKELLGICSNAI